MSRNEGQINWHRGALVGRIGMALSGVRAVAGSKVASEEARELARQIESSLVELQGALRMGDD